MPGGSGPNQPNDAIIAARFSLTIDGVEIAAFSELVGITSEVELMESTEKEVVPKKLPGKIKPATLVLKRGKNNSMEHQANRAVSAAPQISASSAKILGVLRSSATPNPFERE